jgi:nucleoside-diphosphate-sugar epimerase
MSSTSKNVFVTGAGDAAGRAVVRRLVAAGYRVTGTVTGSEQAVQLRKDGGIPAYPDLLREGEIRSTLKGAGANVLVHCAPLLPNQVPHLKMDWEASERLLAEGTPALMRAAEAAGVEFAVIGSYAFVYGDHHGAEVDETAASEHIDEPFIRTALAAEQAALHTNVPAVVLRAAYLYGPYSSGTTDLHQALLRSRPIMLGDSHTLANWVHVDDFARAVLRCIETQPAGEIFNIVDNQPASPDAFARYLAETTNLTLPPQRPAFLTRRGTSKIQAALMGMSAKVSNRKAAEKFDWTPQYRSYREGLEQALLVMRAEEPVA